jgi:hypothetical protein
MVHLDILNGYSLTLLRRLYQSVQHHHLLTSSRVHKPPLRFSLYSFQYESCKI